MHEKRHDKITLRKFEKIQNYYSLFAMAVKVKDDDKRKNMRPCQVCTVPNPTSDFEAEPVQW